LERKRERDLDRGFEMVMRVVKRHTGDELPEVEAKAQQMYLADSRDLDSLDQAISTTALASAAPEKEVSHGDNKEGGFHGGAFKAVEKCISFEGGGQGH